MKPYAIIARVALGLALVVLAIHGTFAYAAEVRVLSKSDILRLPRRLRSSQ
jgi:hypothetical protein